MKLRMIGTGSIAGQSRSASTLIDEKILVDCGNGIVKTIPEQYIPKIDVLLITHLHGDHFVDIIFLILTRHFERMENALSIYCPRGTEKVVQELFALTYPGIDFEQILNNAKANFIEFNELKAEEIMPGYFVTSYRVEHGAMEAYGFTVSHDDATVGFSGDSAYCEGIDEILETSNAAVLDANFMVGNEKHMGLDTIQELTTKYPKVTIIPTHMRDDVRQEMQKLKISNLIVPYDGQEITISPNSML